MTVQDLLKKILSNPNYIVTELFNEYETKFDDILFSVLCSAYYDLIYPTTEELVGVYGSMDHIEVQKWLFFTNEIIIEPIMTYFIDFYVELVTGAFYFNALLKFQSPNIDPSLLSSNLNLVIGGELFLFVSIFIIFIYSLLNSKKAQYLYPLMQQNTIYLSILALILLIVIFNNQTSFLTFETINLLGLFENHYSQNDFYLFIKKAIVFIILIIFLLTLAYTRYNKKVTYEFTLLLLLATWSMLLLIGATDLIAIYLIIELQSFCFYILTATKSNSNFSTEAGLKYFILGSFSSGLLLFGISLLYGFTGLTNLEELKLFLSNLSVNDSTNNLVIYLSLILILISILFKFGLVPFHMYIPDTYTGAPTIVTTLFLVIQKFVILIVYLNLYNTIYICYFKELNYFLIFSILSSIILGSVTALAQSKIKRLIAYSAIVNGGYLLLGISINTIDGVSSSLLFLFIYIILILTLFTIYITTRSYFNNIKLSSFKDFTLMKKGNLMLAVSFSLILFSIAGIPPLAGFYGKLFIFTALIKEQSYILALIAILFTVVTAYYYICLIKIMFFEKTLKFGFFSNLNKVDAYIIALGTLFNIFFFLMPKMFYLIINTILLKLYFYW